MIVEGHALDRSNAPLTMGTPIRAILDGVDYSNGSTVLDASGFFSLMISGNWMVNQSTSETPTIKEGPDLGETILFVAGEIGAVSGVFNETAAWSPGATMNLDLHLGSTATSPRNLRIQGIVTQPARGGTPYAFVCNPTAGFVSLFDYFLEVDRPGAYHGGSVGLAGTVPAGATLGVNLSSSTFLASTGDALKLVYRNPGGASASAGGRDVVVDRVEFNATAGGTLSWEPGNTILADAPAPGIGEILNRTSACGSPFQPGFQLAREPGIPQGTTVFLQVLAPTAGQVLTGGQAFTFRWSMTDDVFQGSSLIVWVNVTFGGASYPLVAAAKGVTSVDWTVPDVSDPAASVHVDVMDPYGSKAAQATAFVIQRSTPFAVLLAILVALIIVAFVLLAWWNARRKAREPPVPQSPPPAAPIRPPPVAPGTAAPPAPPGAKVCPRCGTQVRAEDPVCFYCGHPFAPPP